MNKPITIARQEFTQDIIKLVNDSGLPAFAIRSVLADIDRTLAQLEEQQYMNDKQAWEESQKEGEVDGDSE